MRGTPRSLRSCAFGRREIRMDGIGFHITLRKVWVGASLQAATARLAVTVS